MIWRARTTSFQFPRPTLLMGIVNVTPDSFSDGGACLDPGAAEARAHQLVAEGAELVDVGGESTRPGAPEVSEAEELRRVLPVIERLGSRFPVPLSIDTRKPAVAEAALAAGACIVNDIGASRPDERMAECLARTGAGYVCMHMQGTPLTMQEAPAYQDVVAEVDQFFAGALRRLRQAGVADDQIVLDVGIGFGKTLAHNLGLLAALGRFTRHERPLLLGVSRKSFIGRLLGAGISNRLPGALACTMWAVQTGCQIIRTHDVAATRDAVRMFEAIRASS